MLKKPNVPGQLKSRGPGTTRCQQLCRKCWMYEWSEGGTVVGHLHSWCHIAWWSIMKMILMIHVVHSTAAVRCKSSRLELKSGDSISWSRLQTSFNHTGTDSKTGASLTGDFLWQATSSDASITGRASYESYTCNHIWWNMIKYDRMTTRHLWDQMLQRFDSNLYTKMKKGVVS